MIDPISAENKARINKSFEDNKSDLRRALSEPNPPMPLDSTKGEIVPLSDVSDKDIVEAFTKDPEMKKQANISAFAIQKEFTNWFSIQQLVKKFKTSVPEAAKQIEMLMLFNVCVGKVEKGKAFFKIDISQRAQRSLILEQIAEKEGEILFLKEKLGKLD